MASILDMSTAGAVRQARAAKSAGADALLICPPVVSGWNAGAGPHIALAYHKELAFIAGAIPSAEVRGPQVRVEAAERQALRQIIERTNLKPLPSCDAGKVLVA